MISIYELDVQRQRVPVSVHSVPERVYLDTCQRVGGHVPANTLVRYSSPIRSPVRHLRSPGFTGVVQVERLQRVEACRVYGRN